MSALDESWVIMTYRDYLVCLMQEEQGSIATNAGKSAWRFGKIIVRKGALRARIARHLIGQIRQLRAPLSVRFCNFVAHFLFLAFFD